MSETRKVESRDVGNTKVAMLVFPEKNFEMLCFPIFFSDQVFSQNAVFPDFFFQLSFFGDFGISVVGGEWKTII